MARKYNIRAKPRNAEVAGKGRRVRREKHAGCGQASLRESSGGRRQAGAGGSLMAPWVEQAAGGGGCLAARLGALGCPAQVVPRQSGGLGRFSQEIPQRVGAVRGDRGVDGALPAGARAETVDAAVRIAKRRAEQRGGVEGPAERNAQAADGDGTGGRKDGECKAGQENAQRVNLQRRNPPAPKAGQLFCSSRHE